MTWRIDYVIASERKCMIMLRLCIIGTNESIRALSSRGIFCIGVGNIREAEERVHRMASEGYSPIYISEEFYSDICRDAHEYTDVKSLRLLPPPRSGDIGTIRSILMTGAVRQYA